MGSITHIPTELIQLRKENRELQERNAKLRNTAISALALVDKHKELLDVVVAKVRELRK